MTRQEKLDKARRDELLAKNKLDRLNSSSPNYKEAYQDWANKYWKYKDQQQVDDDLYDAEGCLKLLIYLLIIGVIGYWVIKLLFSIKYF